MSIIDQHSKLLDLLLEKADKIIWETTEEENVFQTAFSKYIIRISNKNNISLFNEEGALIETIEDSRYIHEYFEAKYDSINQQDGFYGDFNIFEELYHVARRKALGVDFALQDIINQLDNKI